MTNMSLESEPNIIGEHPGDLRGVIVNFVSHAIEKARSFGNKDPYHVMTAELKIEGDEGINVIPFPIDKINSVEENENPGSLTIKFKEEIGEHKLRYAVITGATALALVASIRKVKTR